MKIDGRVNRFSASITHSFFSMELWAMGRLFQVHPKNPQRHLVREAAVVIQKGGVVVYPTDSAYALGCQMGNKDAIDRMRRIRRLDSKHHLTLLCRDLSELATYAQV